MFRKTLGRASQFAGGGAHIFVRRADKQLGFLRGEGPAVPVHEPLTGSGGLHVKVDKKRNYFGSHGHGDYPSGARHA